jgi:hypothetical protein
MGYSPESVFWQSGVEVGGDTRIEALFCSEAVEDADVFHD